MSIPCKNSLKKKKIAVVIGERHSGSGAAARITIVGSGTRKTGKRQTVTASREDGDGGQANAGMLFNEINQRLRKVGLKTYSQKEIAAQIAQAEMEAFLNNDMDAAASAAARLKANFVLRGVIDSRSKINPLLGVNEVFLSMSFTLVDAAGRTISNVTAEADAYSGQDTLAVALELVREQADMVVARLYHDYCSSQPR
jgi:hypothetical protein